ncbi:hypothetical protein BLNAU_4875 [Blattamonas nauphoetae]|uniref:Uncharacterized protein n=1 Tax=Blattamonas nauphoetae TaxID=2049346 RepID=A0ABQ9Y897_9EUKA|nr:hypothetical protein BLNAU_4870 [Blattamonas nauphoetae]KAK2959992.1 hypothetical protein BLNAU_4875 [Blattamonas nauphoetae]
MRNSITPTLLQTSSLLNTVVSLFRSPSIPLETTEWTPQLGWHNRNWNGQPSRSSAGMRVNCIARRLIRPNTLPPLTQCCQPTLTSLLFLVFKNIKFGRCMCFERKNSSTDHVLGLNNRAASVCIIV